MILFFGDSLNIWEMSNSSTNEKLPKVHLLYIGSPNNDHGSCYEYAENTLSANKDSELFSLNKEELHNSYKINGDYDNEYFYVISLIFVTPSSVSIFGMRVTRLGIILKYVSRSFAVLIFDIAKYLMF